MMTKQQRHNVKKQFIEIVKLLGPERIRPAGFRKMFKGEPELIQLVDRVEVVDRYMRHIPNLDDNKRDMIVRNMFQS